MNNEKTSMDRRSFLKGAFATGAVATAAVTGVGTLAGCAAQPKEGKAGASASDSKAAGGAYEFETAPDPIPEGDIKETVDADVVVIGAGFSGLCCALAAAESGANVVMLERMDHVIGRGGSIYAMNSKLTKEKGYDSRWQAARKAYLHSHPLCVRCQAEGRLTRATVVDHIVPHRGDPILFWDRENWQALCKSCHDHKTMTEDRYQEFRYR